MQATLTGSEYKIQIKETKFGPEDIRIKIHEVNRKTDKFEPNPTITIYTNINNLAQVLRDHYSQSPFKRQKGESDEQETDRERTSPANSN